MLSEEQLHYAAWEIKYFNERLPTPIRCWCILSSLL